MAPTFSRCCKYRWVALPAKKYAGRARTASADEGQRWRPANSQKFPRNLIPGATDFKERSQLRIASALPPHGSEALNLPERLSPFGNFRHFAYRAAYRGFGAFESGFAGSFL